MSKMNPLRLTLLVAALLAGCASPADDWAGFYDVSVSEESYSCVTEDRVDTFESEGTWILEAVASDEFVVRGQCDIRARVASERTADVVRDVCDTVLPSGRPVRIEVLGGRLYRSDAGDLFGSITMQLTSGADCLRKVVEIAGFEFEE